MTLALADLAGTAADTNTTNTSLTEDGTNLILTDSDSNTVTLPLADIAAVNEPWFGMDDDAGATLNTEDIYTMGKVAIGRATMYGTPAAERLAVDGTIRTAGSSYADYVFEDYLDGFSTIKDDYKFKSLDEVETFIRANKHLPGVTSIKDLPRTEDGDYSFNITELSIQSLEKIEELYLHTIEQQKLIKEQKEDIQMLKTRLAELERLVRK